MAGASSVTRTDLENVILLVIDDSKVNALSPMLVDEIHSALSGAVSERRPIVLAGRSGQFCAGYDLRVMSQSGEPARSLMLKGVGLFLEILRAPVPIVVACTGHALAAGALLLLSADLRIAQQGSFRIGLSEVSIGRPLSEIGVAMARERLDATRISSRVIFSEISGVDAALSDGFFDSVVDKDVVGVAVAEADHLASLDLGVLSVTKGRLRRPLISTIEACLRDAGQEPE
jgi:enoyl-CoA hydratase